jgi:hypothetical protein
MKILHIIPTLSKRGTERLVINIVKQEKTQARIVILVSIIRSQLTF